MKNALLIFLVSSFASAYAQQPIVETPTMIPQSPTPSDIVKIVTKVTTAYQSIVVDIPTASVTNSPKEIKIKSCYSQMMLPATQTHIDTLVLGQLQAGSYVVSHTAFLSSTQQHCSKIDSNMVLTSFTVSSSVSVKEVYQNDFAMYPNPVKHNLYIKNEHNFSTAEIFSSSGNFLKVVEIKSNNTISVNDLTSGLYFIIFKSDINNECRRFVKVD